MALCGLITAWTHCHGGMIQCLCGMFHPEHLWGDMSKYLLKRIVTKSSVWEVNADSVSEAIHATEAGEARQIGWEQSETVVKVVSEDMNEDRSLSEHSKQKQFENA